MNATFQARDYTILAVDDDAYITELIRLYLMGNGFSVRCAADGREALRVVRSSLVHLMILDIMLPEMDGWDVCRTVRESSDLPILMLTAKGESEDKIRGLGLGADDYLVKPFDPNELVARVISLLRRTYSSLRQIKPPASLEIGSLRIDTAAHEVTVGQEVVELTAKEYKLLLALAQHPNQVLDRQQLLDLVWGEDYFGEERVVDVTIKRLRQKLSDEEETWKIETVRGSGYKLKAEG